MNGGRSSGDLVRGEALGLAEVVHEDEEPLSAAPIAGWTALASVPLSAQLAQPWNLSS